MTRVPETEAGDLGALNESHCAGSGGGNVAGGNGVVKAGFDDLPELPSGG